LTSSDPRRLSSKFGADPTAGSVANPKAVGRAAIAGREPNDDRPDRDAFSELVFGGTREAPARGRLLTARPSKLVNPANA
jgi:hypothetical protein